MKQKGPLPEIKLRVMPSGGIVFLNGPFPLDQRKRIKILCEAAPAMLEALKILLAYDEDGPNLISWAQATDQARAVIALAESEAEE